MHFSPPSLVWRSLLPGLLLPALISPGAALAAAAESSGPGRLAASVQTTRRAAKAILARSGDEHCLRGKLTNALLGLSSSCEAEGQRSELCAFSDRVIVTTGWSMTFLEDTARELLTLTSGDLSRLSSPSPSDPAPQP